MKKNPEIKADKGKITTNEQDEKIVVTLSSYYRFFKDFYGGLLFLTLGVASMVGFLLCKMGADYTVGNWALQADQRS